MGFAEDYKAAILSQDVKKYKQFNLKYSNRPNFKNLTDDEIKIVLRFGMLHEGNTEQKQKAIEWLYETENMEILKWI